ncbi:MAG: YybH family protein [Candidatus Latescibacterota bacterium]
MKKLLALVALAMLVLAFGCQQRNAGTAPAAPVLPTQAELDSIRTVLEQAQMDYAKAWSNKDIEFIRTCWSHDADVMLIPPATRERLVGYDAVEEWYMGNFNAIDNVDFKIHDLMIKVTPDGKSAVITYYVENDFTDKATGKPTKMTPRVCVVKTVQDGQWKQIYGDASFSVAELTKK